MPKLNIFHGSDCYEITYASNKITHIDKLMGESQARREIVFDRLPQVVKDEVIITINLEDED
jgi:hypothetical protein